MRIVYFLPLEERDTAVLRLMKSHCCDRTYNKWLFHFHYFWTLSTKPLAFDDIQGNRFDQDLNKFIHVNSQSHRETYVRNSVVKIKEHCSLDKN